ncbi:hypothetical protein [Flavobacterium okayamense]|uniref:Uncharacterized protein n=1 Tax=Flavobacterium okayamense TaxID=2830782 RepID=A0ABN6HS21_9FLAO|nr:hypothetical protein [Flavobacterium okayamense]BCY27418.1 hypothetical protein KK2020170_02860 [Flavobacterium okayamense]
MYTFLYNKFFNFLKSKKSYDPEFNAIGLVFFIQIIHVFLLIKLIGLKVPAFSKDYMTNKLMFIPFGAVWLYIVYLYFKRKTTQIKFEIVSQKHFVILLIFSLLLPLILLIEFSKK